MLSVDEELLLLAIAEGSGRTPPFGPALTDVQLAWLRPRIPPLYFAFVTKHVLTDTVQACCNYLFGVSDIIAWTEMYETLESRYVLVGAASNGDFIAMPRHTWDTVGYISHEEFGYDQSDHVPYRAVSTSLGEFYFNTWHVENYPCDYYDADKN